MTTHLKRKTATKVVVDGDTTNVIYHDTVVVSFTDSTIALDTGGWQTMTTKTRMNQAAEEFGLNFRVSGSIETRSFCPDKPFTVHYKGETFDLVDGMTLSR